MTGIAPHRPMLTAAFIQDAVADWYRIPRDTMRSERRTARLARPRQVAMWLTVKLLPVRSLPRIGRDFDRDHTTVLHAVKVVEKRRKDPAFAAELEELRQAILTVADQPRPSAELALQMAEDTAEAFRKAILALAKADPGAFIRNAATLADRPSPEIAEATPCAA